MSDAVEQFKAVTNADDAAARFYLEACDGDLQRSINMFADQQQQLQRSAIERSTEPDVSTAAALAQRPSGRAARRPAATGFLGRAVAGVFSLVGLGVRSALDLVRAGLGLFLRRSWQLRLSAALDDVVGAWLPRPQQHPALSTAYGEALPPFVEGRWREALSAADAQQRMLLVYLHAPDHVDTDKFCRTVLGHPEVRTFVEDNFVAWAGNINQADAHQLSSMLRVATFPYVGVVTRAGNRRGTQAMQVMSCVEGYCEAGVLLSALAAAVEASSAQLTQARQAQSERDFARRLREEQDAALQASMAADARREEERQAAQAVEAEARAAVQRGEEAARLAQEEQVRAAAARVAAISERRAAAAAALAAAPEPAAAPDATLLRVRLPTGTAVQRRFRVSDTVADVYAFVDAQEELSALEYMLANTFPRRELPRDGPELTLADAGLVPNGTLMVSILDD